MTSSLVPGDPVQDPCLCTRSPLSAGPGDSLPRETWESSSEVDPCPPLRAGFEAGHGNSPNGTSGLQSAATFGPPASKVFYPAGRCAD